MWATTLCVIFVVVTITIHSGDCLSEMGGPCYEGNQSGDCIALNQCKSVQLALTQKKTTLAKVTCYLGGHTPLPFVCCPNGKTPKQNVTLRDAVTLIKDAPPGSRISVQKCYDYAKVVYSNEKTVALIEGTTTVDKCVKVAESLIVNGEDTQKGEFPHMALLGYGKDKNNLKFNCGGSLVSERFVLTAAHCSNFGLPTYVVLGEHIKGSTDDGNDTQSISVGEFIPHPNYVPPAHYFDVALIRLSTEAKLTPLVRPACLHSNQEYGTTVTATGWGQLEFLNPHTSDILFKVDLDEVNPTYCELAHRVHAKLPKGYLSDQQMCVGKVQGGKDTCQGDSGGPIQVLTKDPYCSYLIVGVTSFGKGCALAKTPGVYARVSKFIDWLEGTIWGTNDKKTSSTSKQSSPISDKAALVNSPTTNTAANMPDIKSYVQYNSTIHVAVIKDNKASNYTYNSGTVSSNPIEGFSDGKSKFNFTSIAGLLSSITSQIPTTFPNNEDVKFNFTSLESLLSSLDK